MFDMKSGKHPVSQVSKLKQMPFFLGQLNLTLIAMYLGRLFTQIHKSLPYCQPK